MSRQVQQERSLFLEWMMDCVGSLTGSCKMELAGAEGEVGRVEERAGASCLLGVSGMLLRPTYYGLNSRCPNFFAGKESGKKETP